MQAISDLLLSIYDEAKNASTNEFVNNALGNIQKTLRFDSAGLISIGISSGGELCFKGARVRQLIPDFATFALSRSI